MRKIISEADIEENVLSILGSLGYEIIRGDEEEYLPGGPLALRSSYKDVVLVDRLRYALRRINPAIPEGAREQAVRQVLRSESQKLTVDNENFHKMLVDGVDVPVRAEEGERYEKVWLFDFKEPENNDFLAVNQFTVTENNIERRPDVVLFVNGIPLVILELKNLADEEATIWTAFIVPDIT